MSLFVNDDLKELRRLGFQENQIQTLQAKRKEFQNKDNAECIRFESYLLHEIAQKKAKLNIKTKLDIEEKIIERIKSKFKESIQKYPHDLAMHLSFYKFYIKNNSIILAEKLLEGMLEKFRNDFKVWDAAITFYFDQRKDLDKAFKLINDSLEIYKTCHLSQNHKGPVIQKLLEILIDYVNQSDKEILNASDKHVRCIDYYTSLLNSTLVNDEHFYIGLIKFLQKKDFPPAMQVRIVTILKTNYEHVPEVWDILANRERIGLHLELERNQRSTAKYRAEKCAKVYETGLDKVPDNRKTELWNMYLDCLIEMQNEATANLTKKGLLKKGFELAIDERHVQLAEEYHEVRLQMSTLKEADNVLERALEQYPASLKMYENTIKYYIKNGNTLKLAKKFECARIVLKERAFPLWFMMLRYYSVACSEKEIEALYNMALNEPQEISDKLKPLYISWVVSAKNITAGRELYRKIAVMKPYCKDLHTTMLNLELCQINNNIGQIRSIHKLYCRQFGQNNLDLWNEYLQYCCSNYSSNELNQILPPIAQEAICTLSDDLALKFKEKYQDLKRKLNL